MYAGYVECGFGLIEVSADDECVTAIRFVDKMDFDKTANDVTDETIKQLIEYFTGKRKQFDVQIRLDGTEFQKNVWKAILEIPYGKTATYGDIAERLGNAKAVRAVGSAIGKNPICIIIPCHRVIGKDGAVTGYAWGTDKKKRLLGLEGKYMQ